MILQRLQEAPQSILRHFNEGINDYMPSNWFRDATRIFRKREVPLTFPIETILTNNYGWNDIKSGRHSKKIDITYPIRFVVIHHTADTHCDGTISWFLDPISQASAHYVIRQDGKIFQMVMESDIAWHASWINPWSIGIEVVHEIGEFTIEQYQSLAFLCKQICNRNKIPYQIIANPMQKMNKQELLDFKGIIAHCTATGKDCPGQEFDWCKLQEQMQKWIMKGN